MGSCWVWRACCCKQRASNQGSDVYLIMLDGMARVVALDCVVRSPVARGVVTTQSNGFQTAGTGLYSRPLWRRTRCSSGRGMQPEDLACCPVQPTCNKPSGHLHYIGTDVGAPDTPRCLTFSFRCVAVQVELQSLQVSIASILRMGRNAGSHVPRCARPRCRPIKNAQLWRGVLACDHGATAHRVLYDVEWRETRTPTARSTRVGRRLASF